MINIQKFIQIRKSQKISQNELCKDICTQSTLSKFENNGQVPSFKILQNLCDRMSIEVGDIMTTSKDNVTTQKMFEADFAFITYNYTKVYKLLQEIDPKDLKHKTDQLHYSYLQGMFAFESDRNSMTALFYFNSILNDGTLTKNNIYRLLALNGCSKIYFEEKEMAKAHHYYDQILKYIKDVPIDDELSTLQVLSILCNAGEFYGQEEEFKQSNSLLNYGYKIASEHHTVYFLARILLQMGINDIEQDKRIDIILQHLYDACAFARINKNHVTLVKARNLIKQVENKTTN
ncbi:helix-turn-helix transcriptional regulator [Lactobacillus sp. LL6]|uniref:helix-turn-helix domain-containing protein n=1 Tax=Lactobacillus sp. LL6 TaxID=2596827 RepID=UPI001186AC00|nr:helix-turn-helix transcriptional regulator [Lactobacillus sp. LL6]TSO26809.1 helix-turn-helix transcriptional regulator [Lactobacillus sp. LL6]